MRKILGFLTFSLVVSSLISPLQARADEDKTLLDITASKSSVLNFVVTQSGAKNSINIDASVPGTFTLKGYDDGGFVQDGESNTFQIKELSSAKDATVGAVQKGKNNSVALNVVSSKNKDVDVYIYQDGENNEIKTTELGSIIAYDSVKLNIKQTGNNNKIMINQLNAYNGDVSFNATMINTGEDDNLIGGIDEDSVENIDPNSQSLDDVDRYLQFSYQTGVYMKGSSVNLNAYINGTGNKVGIYQVAESGKAEAEVNIGENIPSSYNTVLIYQNAASGTDAYARVSVEGDGRTVKVYQTGETYADVAVESTYSGSAPIIIKQKSYTPDVPNEVRVTFR